MSFSTFIVVYIRILQSLCVWPFSHQSFLIAIIEVRTFMTSGVPFIYFSIQQFLFLSFFTFTLYHSILLISGCTFMSSALFRTYRTQASSISVPHFASPYCELITFGVHLLQHQSITEPDQPEYASPYSFLIIFMSSGVLLTYFIAFRTRWTLLLRLILYLLFFSGCTFMSSGMFLTYFSIQDSLGLTFLRLIPYSSFQAALSWAPACFSPTLQQHPAVPGPYFFALFYFLLFRLHFHDLRRASHLLQHSELARPERLRLILYLLFFSGCTVLSWAPPCFSPSSSFRTRWALRLCLIYTYSSFQAALSWALACFLPTLASSSRWAWPPWPTAWCSASERRWPTPRPWVSPCGGSLARRDSSTGLLSVDSGSVLSYSTRQVQ